MLQFRKLKCILHILLQFFRYLFFFRIILQEETMLPTGNELITVKKINSFKKELQLNREKVSDQIRDSQLNVYRRNRLDKSKIIPVTDPENVLSSSSDMSNIELFPNMNTESKEYEISHNPIVNFMIINNSPNSRETKVLTNTDMITDDGRMTGITPKITENSMKSQSNDRVAYNRKDLICLVWKKWKRFTLDKKLSMEGDHTSETKNYVSKNTQTYINRKVMRKFWDIWLQVVREKKKALSADHGALQMERIDKFLKELQERKQSLIAITAATMSRDLNNVKKGTENNSKYSYRNFQPKNKRCNTQNIQDNVGFQTKFFPSNLNNEYQYMFEVQQNIIAEQKSKLEEQSKLIKELQLAHLRLQTEKSTKEAEEEINKMLSSCEVRLKPKAKQVKNRLSTVHRRSEFPEKKPIVISLKTVPTIVNRMEERAQERETRWRLIKERKQKLTEERDKRKREEEEERKQREECEKRQKIVELKEKRRHEKQMEIRKKKEREIMHNLIIKASLQYKELLMKKVISSLKQLVAHKWMLTDIAEKHYKTQLLRNSFQIWRTHVQSIISLKMYKVTALYNRILMKKVFRGLFQVIKNQITS